MFNWFGFLTPQQCSSVYWFLGTVKLFLDQDDLRDTVKKLELRQREVLPPRRPSRKRRSSANGPTKRARSTRPKCWSSELAKRRL